MAKARTDRRNRHSRSSTSISGSLGLDAIALIAEQGRLLTLIILSPQTRSAMSSATSTRITVSAIIARPVSHAWKYWTGPEHITGWNAASDDWHCPHAENDLRTGGRFSSRMEARDGSAGFDFGGTYTEVQPQEKITYTMDDGRKCEVLFAEDGNGTRMNVTFDAETENPVEMQRSGWQAILDNFKKYAEKQDQGGSPAR